MWEFSPHAEVNEAGRRGEYLTKHRELSGRVDFARGLVCSLPRAASKFRYNLMYSGFSIIVTATDDRESATSQTCTVLVANAGVI